MRREPWQAPPQAAHRSQAPHVLRQDEVRERDRGHEVGGEVRYGLVPVPVLRRIPPHEQEPDERRRVIREEEIKRNRYQLAKHVYRMRVKSGCTFEEIARAVQCTVGEARELFKEAMR